MSDPTSGRVVVFTASTLPELLDRSSVVIDSHVEYLFRGDGSIKADGSRKAGAL